MISARAGSVSVFQVGVGYRLFFRFFTSRSVIGFGFYKKCRFQCRFSIFTQFNLLNFSSFFLLPVLDSSAVSGVRTQKFSKEGASAAYFSNFTAWLMAIMLYVPLCAICSKKYKVNILTIYFKVQISMTLCTTASGYVTLHRPFTILTVLTI
jgi:hypothetical protein